MHHISIIMAKMQVELIKPFSFSLILTQVSSEIHSVYQNFTSGLIFTCKVLSMSAKDLHSLNPKNSCFYLRKFCINQDQKSISFNLGLLGGGNACLSLSQVIKSKLRKKIEKQDQDNIDKLQNNFVNSITDCSINEESFKKFANQKNLFVSSELTKFQLNSFLRKVWEAPISQTTQIFCDVAR